MKGSFLSLCLGYQEKQIKLKLFTNIIQEIAIKMSTVLFHISSCLDVFRFQ